jgi:putative restriction endonuclease
MSLQKAFYKSLGYELMKELAESYVGTELTPGGARGTYQTLALPNGMHVRFTEWRNGEGPFYIILFMGTKYVFELDLSMIVYRQERFTWHLKVPSHNNNLIMLDDWLGPPAALDDDYSDFVKKVKSSIQSGINTPRTGYRFVDDVEWPSLCDRFLELMRRAIKTHVTGSQPLIEAEDR